MTRPTSSTHPIGWLKAKLSDVASINPPLDRCIIDDEMSTTFVPMAALDVEHGGIVRPETRPFGQVKKGFTDFLPGDVIFAKITPCMENGKVAVVPQVENDVCFGSTEFHVFRPIKGVDPRWISRFIWQSSFRHAARRAMTGGVGQLRVPKEFLSNTELPVAPSKEQVRILDRIDELFSDLDAGVAALERVQRNLERYLASVLKSAVEGRLTAAWRVAHPDVEPASELLKRILAERRRRWEQDQLAAFKAKGKEPPKNWQAKYPEPVAPDTTDLPDLPPRWCWASLDQLGHLDRGRSRHRPRDASHLYGGPYPFIQTGDVRAADQFIRSHSQTYSEAGLAQSRLWPKGTLCITIAANIAETAILSYPVCFPDSVVGVVCDHTSVDVRYVELFVRTVRERLESYAPATAQKNINNNVLRALRVACPPFDEQQAIVSEIERRFSVEAMVQRTAKTGAARALRLRQCILKRAFEGGLVPQDPNDEPAANLLAKCAQATKASAAKPRRPKKGITPTPYA